MSSERERSAYFRAYREANRERIAARDRAYDEAHPERRLRRFKDTRTHRDRPDQRAYRVGHREELAAKKSVYRAAHREESGAYMLRYRAEHTQELATKSQAYRVANRAAINTRGRVSRAQHRDEVNARVRSRYAEHPERWVANKHRRRARVASSDVRAFSQRDWLRLVVRYRGACAYCGLATRALHLEHIIPLVRGGRHSVGNILPSCAACNLSKGTRLLVEWRNRP